MTSATPAKKAKPAEMGNQSSLVQKLISQSPHHHQGLVEIDAQSLLSQLPQQMMVTDEASHLPSSLSPTAGHMLAASDGSSREMNLQSSNSSSNSMDTVAGHELQVASSIELTM